MKPPVALFKKKSMKLPWLIWATYNSFPEISENKTENRPKNNVAACFTSYFVSCFPIFQEMENTQTHAAASLGSCKMILQNNFEPQKRGSVFSLVLEIYMLQSIFKCLFIHSFNF